MASGPQHHSSMTTQEDNNVRTSDLRLDVVNAVVGGFALSAKEAFMREVLVALIVTAACLAIVLSFEVPDSPQRRRMLQQFQRHVNRLGVPKRVKVGFSRVSGVGRLGHMGKPLSMDLRERVVGAISGGMSRRAAQRAWG